MKSILSKKKREKIFKENKEFKDFVPESSFATDNDFNLKFTVSEDESKGIKWLIFIYYLVWATFLLGGLFSIIAWVCMAMIGVVWAKFLLKSLKKEVK